MGRGAFELVVEGPMLVQDAVENIRRNPSRGEAGDLGWRCVSYLRHAKSSRRRAGNGAGRLSMRPLDGSDSVACEYAKCKNRPYMLTVERQLFDIDLCNACRPCRFSRKPEMNDIPSESATSLPEPEPAPKKVLTPAAQRALA